ncbi:hypothetical protein [Paludisphaera sp.]|uniref:hypothetical protein n=1 Tax=Paludisphaera sp. TaxID=2017432 RepID=UPI00301D7FC5
MTGLDLESFLMLLKADLGAWALGALALMAAAILVWVSWGSRNAIRQCLALSVAAHAALLVGGGSVPAMMRALDPGRDQEKAERRVRVTPVVETAAGDLQSRPFGAAEGAGRRAGVAAIDRLDRPVAPTSGRHATERPEADPSSRPAVPEPPRLDAPTLAAATTNAPAVPEPPPPEPAATPLDATPSPLAAPPGPIEAVVDATLEAPEPAAPEPSRAEAPRPSVPIADARLRPARPGRGAEPSPRVVAEAPKVEPPPLAVATIRPTPVETPAPALADLSRSSRPIGPITEVPEMYRPRIEADRSARAVSAGASRASELAVERALDWLARHQDDDGRWDGGTARYADGEAVEGDDDYTVHCPEGDVCEGECAYWEADTGLTGLALLTYLGAGYTHKEGKYARVVARGLTFLLRQQKPDGDLRGASNTVGLYCHAMATLALCEGYALSLDERLCGPAERAVAFLARSRARDGQSWRYAPGAAIGDTSVLGWVVMALKSARESGLPIPEQDSLERGAATWLERVSDGESGGLARYQPVDKVTPTMTAEAWACRQFLGLGGPGPASAEAAAHLLEHESDRGETNVYYWYYGTLAMYQHGGRPWAEWNGRLRDRVVTLQRTGGHMAGSWDPDESIYGARGGRIYCTALATLTLEVYYRYLRLYDEPSLPEHFDEDDELPDPAPPLEAPNLR